MEIVVFDSEANAENIGREDFKNGVPRNVCPFESKTLSECWHKGYDSERNDSEPLDDSEHEHNEEMYEEYGDIKDFWDAFGILH